MEERLIPEYSDRSDENGFEFVFFCTTCWAQYPSVRTPWTGGADEAAREQAHAQALQEAIDAVQPLFKRCERCNKVACVDDFPPQDTWCKECVEWQPVLRGDEEEKYKDTKEYHDEEPDIPFVMKSMFCPHCDAKIPHGVMLCPFCGKRVDLVESKHCKACNTEVREGLAFCPVCGAFIS
ncbi:MAG: zinc ribbon domain-containing protein [Clostridia bacterium]|nr:zinc ribbon domain-containing protein [Clostridia bacterium]